MNNLSDGRSGPTAANPADAPAKKRRRRRKPAILVFSLFFIMTLSLVCYGLADRYLIEHVTAVAVSPTLTATATTAGSGNEATDEAASAGGGDTTIASAAATTASSANTTSTANSASNATAASASTDGMDSAAATYDDWSYVSDDVQVQITKVESGSGSDKITYYVADVQVADGENLSTAFAKNLVGENITQDTSVIAENNNAILAINGDYYGFRDDGILIRNGVAYRDAGVRTGAAIYADGTLDTYDETTTDAASLLAAGVTDTFSFGPILISDGVVTTDFENIAIDTNMGNRTIDNANPRTGIGMIAPNHYVFIVVDGRSSGYSRGVTLTEFAQIFADLGCTEAYNLDGGGSSTMYFMGRVVNNPLGKGEERGVSDILYVTD